jgi:hypothetical protein
MAVERDGEPMNGRRTVETSAERRGRTVIVGSSILVGCGE